MLLSELFHAEKSSFEVKISDFGLSRSLGVGEDYYRSEFSPNLKLPIAWLEIKFTSLVSINLKSVKVCTRMHQLSKIYILFGRLVIWSHTV